ncbi:MAG TPA: DUF2171 domain-containing protein [Pseudolabrys sp.]|nr:DUF2171 domain-containing protein [Pseudolabrys sp.]
MTKFIGKLEPEMDVESSDGCHIGKVDREDGPDRIQLQSEDGGERFVNWDWVDHIEPGKLILNVRRTQVAVAWRKIPGAHVG